ncbi:Calvin cycle protein CP12-2, chloroplastic [Vitis vinifera]|uniref:Calvin cycle protein CP12-2, chloroplastic n=1 Tax=Vitis vinifera TaxID=29760 RepID=A0A438G7U6_VITVI|nr:Calvin cycle protein CP12-2, chloroplastic [Vitis vinifera]
MATIAGVSLSTPRVLARAADSPKEVLRRSASGECVAAWDEVEELSAAASHARDKKKESDPLETYCKDNPEDEECRTYED